MLVPTDTQHLVLTTYNPVVIHIEIPIAAGFDELVLTEYAATVKVDIAFDTAVADALVIAEYNPSVNFINAVNTNVDALVIATFNTAIIAGLVIYPGFDELRIAEYPPEISRTLPDLTNEISSGSRMIKELKENSEMSL